MAAAMEGPLSKWTNVMKGWQYRWFVLDDNTGLLSYYTSKEKMMKGARRGCVRMKNAVIGIDDGEDSTFTITVDNKTFHFQARDGEEREKWIHALEETKNHHALLRHRRWDGLAEHSIQDFEKKLTETDCYLQIFIDQIKNLELRMEKCNNEEEKEKYLKIHEQANSMLDYVKHAIVLLQIAKNTAKPDKSFANPTSEPLMESSSKMPPPIPIAEVHGKDSSEDEQHAASSKVKVSSVPSMEVLDKLINLNKVIPTEDSNKVANSVLDGSVMSQLANPPVILVPETSYSSSEDDDFYDAYEDALSTTSHSPSSTVVPVASDNPSVKRKGTDGDKNWFINGIIDYDEMYNADDEEDLGSLEEHGSVISHLLSQVKLGMDLTKVVLPTFILECRSLLEMYADFFAHPDLFTSIVDYSDPKDRMVQVVRWYLSAFHAGRKSSVAKKPYNPILGETFRCYWNIPSDKKPESAQASTSSTSTKVSDGPVPWANPDQLTFVAEQVSHHPPISAFYGEHYNKRISFCAHIWTKSKFLGLSIGVHNIGQGCVSLLDYDEEYIITFPNGYGRSILTVPWIELGGSINISCAKTGYNANIEFVTKPFYGGKRHRVTADLFQPNDKKPFLHVNGEWNGIMHAKWANGKSEMFIDTKSMPIIMKEVRPVSSQQPFESRKLWKEVTAYLRLKNVDKATAEKFKLEQKQREEAKQRKEANTSWETRLFHEVGANWVYDEPLQKRLSSASSTSHSHPE